MQLAVSAVGLDRPGIVAAISRVLLEHDGNIEDSRMALLGGHFAVMLIVEVPDDTDPVAVEESVLSATAGMDLVVTVRPVAHAASDHLEGTPYVLTVYGADRPGIVADVTGALARWDVNVTDLATHVLEGKIYVMIIEVSLPAGTVPGKVERALRDAASGVDLSFHPVEAETL
ncbi:MAG: glycine cleavage system protein R [Actinomycetota bacterium]|nr:ACT domain-containing protein [Actinomycetota bacterium]